MKIAPLIAVIALGLITSWAIFNGTSRADKAANADNVANAGLIGTEFPQQAFDTLDGKKVSVAGEKENVVVIDYWATWCPPCILSLPYLQELANDADLAKKGLVVWAVNAGEEADVVNAFLKKNGYTFKTLLDADGAAFQKLRFEGIPTTVVVGRDGKIAYTSVGYQPQVSEKNLRAAVVAALQK